jgi:hypothetical protein
MALSEVELGRIVAEAGAPDATVMSLAGHISPEMLAHYSHVRMEAKRTALAALDGGLMSNTTPEDEAVSEAVN